MEQLTAHSFSKETILESHRTSSTTRCDAELDRLHLTSQEYWPIKNATYELRGFISFSNGLFFSAMSFVNHLADIGHLHNRHVLVRHGESEANVAHLISSDPEIGTKTHGLTPQGRLQVLQNAQSFVKDNPCSDKTIIVSSDFRRARETADILASQLPKFLSQGLSVQVDPRLRERFFGIYDGESDEKYPLIWENDQENPAENLADQVESVDSVRDRTTAVIKELHEKYSDTTIFIVSHGDSLQILQTAFAGMPSANQHRTLPHLERAEFRSVLLNK